MSAVGRRGSRSSLSVDSVVVATWRTSGDGACGCRGCHPRPLDASSGRWCHACAPPSPPHVKSGCREFHPHSPKGAAYPATHIATHEAIHNAATALQWEYQNDYDGNDRRHKRENRAMAMTPIGPARAIVTSFMSAANREWLRRFPKKCRCVAVAAGDSSKSSPVCLSQSLTENDGAEDGTRSA